MKNSILITLLLLALLIILPYLISLFFRKKGDAKKLAAGKALLIGGGITLLLSIYLIMQSLETRDTGVVSYWSAILSGIVMIYGLHNMISESTKNKLFIYGNLLLFLTIGTLTLLPKDRNIMLTLWILFYMFLLGVLPYLIGMYFKKHGNSDKIAAGRAALIGGGLSLLYSMYLSVQYSNAFIIGGIFILFAFISGLLVLYGLKSLISARKT